MFTKMRVRAMELVKDEAGDVPGWVLITIMTAALALAIWAFAGDALVNMVETALSGVQFN